LFQYAKCKFFNLILHLLLLKEKERCGRIKPNYLFFHISKGVKPSKEQKSKCLITEVEKNTKARPLLSSRRGE